MTDKPKRWMYDGTEFMSCPKCSKGIPAVWKEHKVCGWKSEIVADPIPQTDVRSFKEGSNYSDKGDEIARMSAVKTAAEVLGSQDMVKLREMTLMIYSWIKTGQFEIPIQVEEVK